MAQTHELSIDAALQKVAVKKKSLLKSISEDIFCSVARGEDPKNQRLIVDGLAKTPEDLVNRIKADFQALEDGINYFIALKLAISRSNAKIEHDVEGPISICGRKLFANEVLLLREIIKEIHQQLLYQLKRQWDTSSRLFTKEQTNFEQEVEKSIQTIVGKDSNRKTTDGDFEQIRQLKRDLLSPVYIDPLEIQKVIDKYEKFIEEFELNQSTEIRKYNVNNNVTFVV